MLGGFEIPPNDVKGAVKSAVKRKYLLIVEVKHL